MEHQRKAQFTHTCHSREEADEKARNLDMKLFKTSVKENSNVEDGNVVHAVHLYFLKKGLD